MKLRAACVVLGFISLALSLAKPAAAQTTSEATSALPHLVRFNGTAKDLNGNPQTGVIGITFAFYSEQTGGAALWIETQNVTADNNGHYAALLGSTKPDGLPTDLFTTAQARWVGVQVSGQPEQARVLLLSVPYALKAGDAETVGGKPASAFMPAPNSSTSGSSNAASPTSVIAQSNAAPALSGGGTKGYVPLWLASTRLGNSNLFENTAGNVGIGTTIPTATLDVHGSGNFTGATQVGTSAPHPGLTATGSDGTIYSGNGTSGVVGTGGNGNTLQAFGGTGVVGMGGTANIYGGIGVVGTGGPGTSESGLGGSGVVGYATAGACCAAPGVAGYGALGSPGIMGVGGEGGLGNVGVGVWAEGASNNEPFDGDGIYATNPDGGTKKTGGYAGYFKGDINVTGTVYAATKDFRIDHPTDPANKYLLHASVESSEMMNIYSGNATLDGSGQAVVQLPTWFEAVNGDFRYQLTSIGAPGPGLYIAQEISGNHFKIAGGSAASKVSWQVTAVRHDAYAKANPLIVEQEKSARERGYYIHPELYGAPKERGIATARYAETMLHFPKRKTPPHPLTPQPTKLQPTKTASH